MSMPQVLARTVFETSRAAEYFTVRELQAQTGQPRERFAAVALKELVDNALDACETAGIAPSIEIEIAIEPRLLRITVGDNGSGIPPGDGAADPQLSDTDLRQSGLPIADTWCPRERA